MNAYRKNNLVFGLLVSATLAVVVGVSHLLMGHSESANLPAPSVLSVPPLPPSGSIQDALDSFAKAAAYSYAHQPDPSDATLRAAEMARTFEGVFSCRVIDFQIGTELGQETKTGYRESANQHGGIAAFGNAKAAKGILDVDGEQVKRVYVAAAVSCT